MPPDRQNSTEHPHAEALGFRSCFLSLQVQGMIRYSHPHAHVWLPAGHACPGGGGWRHGRITLDNLSWGWTRRVQAQVIPRATGLSLGEQGQRCNCCQHSWEEPCWVLAHQSLSLIEDLISRSLELTHSLLSPRNPFSLSLYQPVGKTTKHWGAAVR